MAACDIVNAYTQVTQVMQTPIHATHFSWALCLESWYIGSRLFACLLTSAYCSRVSQYMQRRHCKWSYCRWLETDWPTWLLLSVRRKDQPAKIQGLCANGMQCSKKQRMQITIIGDLFRQPRKASIKRNFSDKSKWGQMLKKDMYWNIAYGRKE